MSLIAQVAEIAGTTTADVHRVLSGVSHGGTTQTDWAIAHAIHTVTGRDPYELMLTAGRTAEVARIWADTGTPAETPAQTNPRAIHDPEVRIYAENTSPEATPTVLPDHPSTHVDDTVEDVEDTEGAEEQAERVAANHLAEAVFADLAEVLDNPGAAHRLTRAWTTPAEGRQLLTQVLEIHANTHLRTEIAVRTIEADLAA